MSINFRHTVFFSAFIILLTTGCKKMTDEHNEVTDPALGKNLMDLIDGNQNLTTFAGYLRQTGYDKELKSAKSFTVFSPDNIKFIGIEQPILKDSNKFKKIYG